MPLTFAQNTTNITSSIPSNAIRTPNGGEITPFQTHQNNGSNLTIHYETGVDVSGKIMPTGPPPLLENLSPLPTIIVIGVIIGASVVGISVFIRMKKK